MEKSVFRSTSRGHADYGWLKANYSFSFSEYYDSEKIHFGALRVLNDDTISGGKGFPTHPHEDMEIITIPLSGALEHKDNIGNSGVVREGEIQIMSAGTGIQHSEFNPDIDREVNLFQIWIYPKTKGVYPRYDQVAIKDLRRANSLYQIVSPEPDDTGSWIHQDAWMLMGEFTEVIDINYKIKRKNNIAFLMVIEGEVVLDSTTLGHRDAIGISETSEFSFKTKDNTRVLLIDVPKTW